MGRHYPITDNYSFLVGIRVHWNQQSITSGCFCFLFYCQHEWNKPNWRITSLVETVPVTELPEEKFSRMTSIVETACYRITRVFISQYLFTECTFVCDKRTYSTIARYALKLHFWEWIQTSNKSCYFRVLWKHLHYWRISRSLLHLATSHAGLGLQQRQRHCCYKDGKQLNNWRFPYGQHQNKP